MKKIEEVQIGDKVNHHEKGEGIVSGKTKRTITITFARSTSKNTYNSNDAYFYVSDF